MEPVSPLPWRDELYRSWVVDADGQWVAEFSEAEDLTYAVEAANAYPRLRERLDQALEACRYLLLLRNALDYYVEQGANIAREALEMAEERDGDG